MAIGESGFAACPPTHVLFAQTVSLRRFAWNFPLTASQNARLGHRRNILDSNELRLFDRSLSSSSVLEPRGFDRFNPHPCLYCRNSCFANFRHRGHLLSRHLGYCKTPGDRCPMDKIDALPYRVLKHFSRQCQSLCVSSQ